eukprot:GHVO01021712.1.p1 GENE.GHVO01021712.1~~GHVO01021712.1.p1  ORF type:complete len:152 (-),score=12.32 GHVO01021712.1:240-695(-)
MDDLVNIAKEAFSFCTFSDYTIPVTLQINHHSVNALVDTGSWWSLIPNHIAEKIGLTPTETSINLHGIGKTQGFQAEPMLVTINDFPPTEIRFVIIPDAKLPCLLLMPKTEFTKSRRPICLQGRMAKTPHREMYSWDTPFHRARSTEEGKS